MPCHTLPIVLISSFAKCGRDVCGDEALAGGDEVQGGGDEIPGRGARVLRMQDPSCHRRDWASLEALADTEGGGRRRECLGASYCRLIRGRTHSVPPCTVHILPLFWVLLSSALPKQQLCAPSSSSTRILVYLFRLSGAGPGLLHEIAVSAFSRNPLGRAK